MSIELNHTIVGATDKHASARFSRTSSAGPSARTMGLHPGAAG